MEGARERPEGGKEGGREGGLVGSTEGREERREGGREGGKKRTEDVKHARLILGERADMTDIVGAHFEGAAVFPNLADVVDEDHSLKHSGGGALREGGREGGREGSV